MTNIFNQVKLRIKQNIKINLLMKKKLLAFSVFISCSIFQKKKENGLFCKTPKI